MTLEKLKSLKTTDIVFREILKNIKQKKYICEEALISEEAENLLKSYSYVYEKTRKNEYQQHCFYLNTCILPSYKPFNEVAELLEPFIKNNITSINDLYIETKKYTEDFKYTKYSTFLEAVEFLKLK